MGTVEFLSSLLPEQGLKVVCELRPNGGPLHYAFDTIEEAAKKCAAISARKHQAFFALATYADRDAVNPRSGKKFIRFTENAVALKTLFLDLDVGKTPATSYPSKEEAAVALKAFVKKVGLPPPTTVDSGGGIHAYWPFTMPVAASQWKQLAEAFKALCIVEGLRIDPTVPADVCRILRPIGTFNYKQDYPAPLEVKLLYASAPTDPRELRRIVQAQGGVAINTSGLWLQAPAYGFELGNNLGDKKTLEPIHFPTLYENCAQFRHQVDTRGAITGGEDTQEPLWYATLSLTRLCTQPDRANLIVSDGHKGFTPAKLAVKIGQLTRGNIGPVLCSRMNELNPNVCPNCPFWGKIKSPAAVGHKAREAPPPVVIVEDEEGEQTKIELPNPPKPYLRLFDGGIGVMSKNEEGVPYTDVIFRHDIYPVRLERMESTGEQTVITRHHHPKDGWREFSVTLREVGGARVVEALMAKGVVPDYKKRDKFKEFFVSYIQQLQKQSATVDVYRRLGWNGDDFILMGKRVTPTTIEDVRVDPETERAMSGMRKAGTFDEWKEAMKFYNRPGQEGHAFAFLAGFGAPLLRFTGLHGAIISMLGPTGHGKSATLNMQSSIWGSPADLTINGMPQASTKIGRMVRISIHNNLPVALDEVTKMDPEEVSEMCYLISQGKGKIRADKEGKDKGNLESWCTIMTCSTNTSLLSKLTYNTADASAEQARVFEFDCSKPLTEEETIAAKRMITTATDNYGWAGEAFIDVVVKNRALITDAVRDEQAAIDRKTNIGSIGRFWVGAAAANLTAGRICVERGILPWSMVTMRRIREWVIAHIKQSLQDVNDETSYAEDVLSNYLNAHLNSTLIVGAPNALGNVSLSDQRLNELHIRVELDTHRIWIDKKHFKQFCTKQSASGLHIIKSLMEKKVVLFADNATRKCLGRGTKYDRGRQTLCMLVDADAVTGIDFTPPNVAP